MDLQISRASCSPHQSNVARRRERKLNRPRVVQKSGQIYLVLGRTRAGFSKPPQPTVTLVLNVGSLKEHRIVVATEPLRVWDTSVARH